MSDDKKIIIDEDWKSQVQREKEEAAKSQGDSSSDASAPPQAPAASAAESPEPEEHDPAMPPASFEMLLTTLATEALVALGAVPHPVTGHQHAHPNQAKYLIDTIDVLRQKTAGNLSANEGQMLESLLHQLKLVFVEITTRGGTKPAST